MSIKIRSNCGVRRSQVNRHCAVRGSQHDKAMFLQQGFLTQCNQGFIFNQQDGLRSCLVCQGSHFFVSIHYTASLTNIPVMTFSKTGDIMPSLRKCNDQMLLIIHARLFKEIRRNVRQKHKFLSKNLSEILSFLFFITTV